MTVPMDGGSATTSRGGIDPGLVGLAGVASLGAGAIHAAAIGAHAGARQTVLTFLVTAAVQLGFGAAALVRRERWLAVIGVIVNAAFFGGWVLAKTRGISFIDGLEQSEAVQWADGAAAALAGISVVAAAGALLARPTAVLDQRLSSALTSSLGVGLIVVAIVGMNATGGHRHGHAGGDHGQAETAAAADDHAHGATDDHSAAGSTDAAGGSTTTSPDDSHAAPVVAKPYDPAKPIDLSGTKGVSAKQQARAENMIAVTLADLPHWKDYKTAEAEGWVSIGDGITGYEHFINWKLLSDDKVLDPNAPEALVYRLKGNEKTLVSAMFMDEPGSTLDDVPDLGGALTQWHIHDDLCFTDDAVAPHVVGVTSVGGTCRPPLKKFTPVPMIHVWIVAHPCGPFAALEGVGAGQVKAGEERLCDHAHGS